MEPQLKFNFSLVWHLVCVYEDIMCVVGTSVRGPYRRGIFYQASVRICLTCMVPVPT